MSRVLLSFLLPHKLFYNQFIPTDKIHKMITNNAELVLHHSIFPHLSTLLKMKTKKSRSYNNDDKNTNID